MVPHCSALSDEQRDALARAFERTVQTCELLVSYAVGALLGVALLALLPEALAELSPQPVFVTLLAGILIFSEPLFRDRKLIARYAWPVCFLISGLFVLVFSDTELWPFGPKSWLQGMLTNHEVMQHKTFAVLLLALGAIELARARNKLTAAWSAWVFPVFAFLGSILLLFHSHDAGMHGPDHMATMQRIQAQHFSYSGTGLGIGLAKGLSEVPNKWQSIFARLYPTLMIVLGILLMVYVE